MKRMFLIFAVFACHIMYAQEDPKTPINPETHYPDGSPRGGTEENILQQYDEKEAAIAEEEEYEEPDPDAFFIDHNVTMGETMIMVSRKYMVDPKEIYDYNEEAVQGLKSGTILKIPLHKSAKKDLDGFKKALEKKKGGPIQVPAPPKKKKKPEAEEEE